MGMTIFDTRAYDSGVLLSWNAGAGNSSSTASNLAEITIQYSTSGEPNVIPNVPPYVVRELQQPQLADNILYHPYLINGVPYTYSLFVHYMDTGIWEGPLIAGPSTPTAGLGAPLVSGSLSFSKLDVNTILTSNKDSKTDIIVWLSDNQITRRADLTNTFNALKPSHTRVVISYEDYYVAQTTTEHFQSGSYASGSYDIINGTLKNKIATIDSSFNGLRAIYGG